MHGIKNKYEVSSFCMTVRHTNKFDYSLYDGSVCHNIYQKVKFKIKSCYDLLLFDMRMMLIIIRTLPAMVNYLPSFRPFIRLSFSPSLLPSFPPLPLPSFLPSPFNPSHLPSFFHSLLPYVLHSAQELNVVPVAFVGCRVRSRGFGISGPRIALSSSLSLKTGRCMCPQWLPTDERCQFCWSVEMQ